MLPASVALNSLARALDASVELNRLPTAADLATLRDAIRALEPRVMDLEASHAALRHLLAAEDALVPARPVPVRLDRMRGSGGRLSAIGPGLVISGCFRRIPVVEMTAVTPKAAVTTRHLSGCFVATGGAR